MTYVVGLDIETTGLLKPDQRIIEIYAGLWDAGTRELVDEFSTRINPQRSISAEAERVHGISLAMLSGCPLFSTIAGDFLAFIRRGALIVAHNGDGFDIPFINMELAVNGRTGIDMPTVDTMLASRWAKPDGSVPNLGALCLACDVPYDTKRAHAADYDVAVMMSAFWKAVDWGFIIPPVAIESRAKAA